MPQRSHYATDLMQEIYGGGQQKAASERAQEEERDREMRQRETGAVMAGTF